MGQCGGCSKKQEKREKSCPLCYKKGNYIHPLAVQSVVKDEVKPVIVEESYYVCQNEDCDAVFFDENDTQMILVIDVNLTADFKSVTKEKKSCHDCGSGCGRK